MKTNVNEAYETHLLDTAALDAFAVASSRRTRSEPAEAIALDRIRREIIADVERAEMKANRR